MPYLVNMTKRDADQIGGADYTFDCTGNTKVMRQALECCRIAAGASRSSSAWPVPARKSPPARSSWSPAAVWMGTAFGGARGRTDVPKIVDWYMEGKIEIDPMITHTMPLEDINKGFELMHSGQSIRERGRLLILPTGRRPNTGIRFEAGGRPPLLCLRGASVNSPMPLVP